MTEPLRIVLPIHSFEPGGVERVALNLARHWQDAGHDVVVVLGRNEGPDRGCAPPGLRYWSCRSFIPTAPFETIWMMWCLCLYLARGRADVLFCPGNTYTVVCVVMKLLLGDRCPPVVVKVSNDLVRADKPLLRRLWYRLWLRLNGLFLDRFVALAEPMFDEVVKGMGVAAHRVTTIHDPALDRRRFERLQAMPRERAAGRALRYLAVGRLAAQKNVEMLLMAFASGFRPGDRLTIVGAGPELGALRRVVRTMALRGIVTFTGHLPSPDEHFRTSDCLLLSSNYEGVPAVVIEAIAAGLPVIATDCCASMKSLLGGGTRGVLVPVGDVHAMAQAIARPERLPQPGPGERAYAARFSLELAATSYLAIMREAVAVSDQVRTALLPELLR
ncbi:MAG: glycosyltransferase [Novosphingobium sp.]|uniref:glycosyltransferase n=1 Tax=Novosphingobium sp. TaxID=1874826 RepID=UPI0012C91AA5|nr:glycosyltransferase [Novosphingobium sp.]MPS69127.1 glycosyltransferase [Novosphingobium sp.]